MPVDYEKQAYWRDRFASETCFEWLTPSETFTAILEPYLSSLSPSARILNLGSGTSDLHNHLRNRGFLGVTNVDYEPLALERGRQLESQAFGNVQMEYLAADVTQLNVSKSFDLVIDKSTADAVSCGGETAILRMASGVKKHLADGGVWISMSYSASRFRNQDLPFSVQIINEIPTAKFRPTDPDVYHYCYLLRPK